MTDSGSYKWVDFASSGMPGFRNMIAPVGELERLMDQYKQTDCYSTYYIFDQRLLDHVKRNGDSVAGYGGPCWASILPFDIDSTDLDRALRTTRDLCRFFLDSWGVPEDAVIPYFSGKKGFHVTVSTQVFGGVEPGEGLPQVLQGVRRRVVTDARPRYPDTVDFIGDRLRLLRLPNSRHSDTGLYKVPLTVDELLDCEPDEIRAFAVAPRPTVLTDETGLVPLYDSGVIPSAEDAYQDCLRAEREHARDDLPDAETYRRRGDLDGFLCAAERKLYEGGVGEGARSSTALRLASRMRAAGYSEDEAGEMVMSWDERNDPRMRTGEPRRIVGVAYSSYQPYQFGCGTGTDDHPGTALIFEACPYSDRSECDVFQAFSETRLAAARRE